MLASYDDRRGEKRKHWPAQLLLGKLWQSASIFCTRAGGAELKSRNISERPPSHFGSRAGRTKLFFRWGPETPAKRTVCVVRTKRFQGEQQHDGSCHDIWSVEPMKYSSHSFAVTATWMQHRISNAHIALAQDALHFLDLYHMIHVLLFGGSCSCLLIRCIEIVK